MSSAAPATTTSLRDAGWALEQALNDDWSEVAIGTDCDDGYMVYDRSIATGSDSEEPRRTEEGNRTHQQSIELQLWHSRAYGCPLGKNRATATLRQPTHEQPRTQVSTDTLRQHAPRRIDDTPAPLISPGNDPGMHANEEPS